MLSNRPIWNYFRSSIFHPYAHRERMEKGEKRKEREEEKIERGKEKERKRKREIKGKRNTAWPVAGCVKPLHTSLALSTVLPLLIPNKLVQLCKVVPNYLSPGFSLPPLRMAFPRTYFTCTHLVL